LPGLGLAKVAQIKAAFELGKRLCAAKLSAPAFESSKAVADHFRPRFTGRPHEVVIAIFLNGQNQRWGENEISEGTPTQTTVYVRRIIEEALHFPSTLSFRFLFRGVGVLFKKPFKIFLNSNFLELNDFDNLCSSGGVSRLHRLMGVSQEAENAPGWKREMLGSIRAAASDLKSNVSEAQILRRIRRYHADGDKSPEISIALPKEKTAW
jgi:hypothetical protein